MKNTTLSINKIAARAIHTSRRASYLIDLRSRDMNNKKLRELTAKSCFIAYKWLMIYEERSKEEEDKNTIS
ncbi:hypothetical protein HA050_01950 [Iodobacter sp. HSC-16F04]|uniref:Uncharacterized protein n=1 Tax=Iodobacter violaceini TaxID=3044271 RepID=A0ABX0KXE3_9NEIS|nr:hypothetical protein [Iodobacter violacea]NHQ84873.1 hypothetical protein [Iodobacter violacea]